MCYCSSPDCTDNLPFRTATALRTSSRIGSARVVQAVTTAGHPAPGVMSVHEAVAASAEDVVVAAAADSVGVSRRGAQLTFLVAHSNVKTLANRVSHAPRTTPGARATPSPRSVVSLAVAGASAARARSAAVEGAAAVVAAALEDHAVIARADQNALA